MCFAVLQLGRTARCASTTHVEDYLTQAPCKHKPCACSKQLASWSLLSYVCNHQFVFEVGDCSLLLLIHLAQQRAKTVRQYLSTWRVGVFSRKARNEVARSTVSRLQNKRFTVKHDNKSIMKLSKVANFGSNFVSMLIFRPLVGVKCKKGPQKWVFQQILSRSMSWHFIFEKYFDEISVFPFRCPIYVTRMFGQKKNNLNSSRTRIRAF